MGLCTQLFRAKTIARDSRSIELYFNFELNEVFKSLDTIYKQFVFYTEKLKDTTHGLSQLSHSSRYLEIQWFTCEHSAIRYSQGYTTGVVGYSDELPL